MNAYETVEQYYAYFNQGNKEGMLSLVSSGIRHEPNQGEPRIGKALFAEFLDRMEECYSEELKDLVLFTSATDGRVAAEFMVYGTYKKAEPGMPAAHGQQYVLPAGAFLEVRNGQIMRVTTYYNLERWLSVVSAT